jgi:tRNA threonylcarbamoyladenosine biosynthesis protein TsaB
MPLILSIETSTPICSVALHLDNQLLASAYLGTAQSHSSMLTSLIQQVIQNADKELKDIQAIAIAKGPGSYTGLRIGTSTAKGLCYALGVPLLAVNTLEAMAYQFYQTKWDNVWLCPMLDARRMEVYCAIFDQNMHEIEPTQAKIIDETSFAEYLLNQKIIFFGDGSTKCKQKLQNSTNAFFVDDIVPSAVTIGYLALQLFQRQSFEDLAYFEPFYLKDFVNTTPKKNYDS